jgi:hypothetical protein
MAISSQLLKPPSCASAACQIGGFGDQLRDAAGFGMVAGGHHQAGALAG